MSDAVEAGVIASAAATGRRERMRARFELRELMFWLMFFMGWVLGLVGFGLGRNED